MTEVLAVFVPVTTLRKSSQCEHAAVGGLRAAQYSVPGVYNPLATPQF